MDWLKKAPASVVVALIAVCGVLCVSVLTAFVILSIRGIDTTDLRQWIQTIGVTIILPLLGVNTVTGIIAAKSSSNAEDQTNGLHTAQMVKIANDAASKAVARALRGDRDNLA